MNIVKRLPKFKDYEAIQKACEEIWNRIDDDGSGTISFDEFVQAVCQQKKYMTKKNFINVFYQLDSNGNNKI